MELSKELDDMDIDTNDRAYLKKRITKLETAIRVARGCTENAELELNKRITELEALYVEGIKRIGGLLEENKRLRSERDAARATIKKYLPKYQYGIGE